MGANIGDVSGMFPGGVVIEPPMRLREDLGDGRVKD
jgi:hypothetical protein